MNHHRSRTAYAWAIGGWLLMGSACSNSLPRDEPEPEAHILYDPQAGKLPLPNDVLRDPAEGHLALPIAPDLPPAEKELRAFMNTHDAWSTTMPIAAEASAPIAGGSVTPETVLLYQLGDAPRQVTDARPSIDATGTRISIAPPPAGWSRGERYVVVVRGGAHGLRTETGHPIGPDRIFFYLRSRERLDTEENNRAFPGSTREERLALARKLEVVRAGLSPIFDLVEAPPIAIPRDDVAALWSFSITSASELAMDPLVGRVPLPFDGLVDPATKRVTLRASASDSPEIAGIKQRLNCMNGFSVAPTIDLELVSAVDPRTADGALRPGEAPGRARTTAAVSRRPGARWTSRRSR